MARGSPWFRIGRWVRRAVRATRTSSSARSHTDRPCSRIAARGLRIHEGAAAGRQDMHRLVLDQPGDDAAFDGAEDRLAVAGEDLGDGAAGRGLDLGVGVAEGQMQSAPASRRPMALLPAPINPTSTTVRGSSGCAASAIRVPGTWAVIALRSPIASIRSATRPFTPSTRVPPSAGSGRHAAATDNTHTCRNRAGTSAPGIAGTRSPCRAAPGNPRRAGCVAVQPVATLRHRPAGCPRSGDVPDRRSPPARPGCGCFSRKALACPKPCGRRAW